MGESREGAVCVGCTHTHTGILFLFLPTVATLHILHRDEKSKQPLLAKDFLQVVPPGPGSHQHSLPHLVPRLPAQDQQQLVAAEAGASQSNPKPEVEHEDDKHLRAKESS